MAKRVKRIRIQSITEQRKRQERKQGIHVVDDQSTPEEITAAKDSLIEFFEDSFTKHHPGY